MANEVHMEFENAADIEVIEEVDLDSELDADSPWHVVLLDDNDHSYDYVIEMLCEIFGYSIVRSYLMAVEVDTNKRVIVWTGHLEVAEHKQSLIHAYGPDWRMSQSQGSMTAILERAR